MKIRHSILFLAAGVMAAALSLSSCEERVGSEGGDFGFSASAVSYTGPGAWTKATPINTVSAFESTYTSFKVNAYKGSTAKFTDKTSSYSAGEWNLNTTAKWYPNETLDFYALAFPETNPPMITLVGNMIVNPSTKTAIFDYTFSPAHSAIGENTPDIMFGYYTGQGVLNTAGSKKIAPLTFYHPFTALKFKAGADLVGATVNSITIKNVANGGTCTIAASNLATAGNSAISWTTDAGHIDYSNTYSATITAADQQIGTDAQTFVIIPQTMGETAKLEVKLTVNVDGVDKDYTLEASLSNLTFNAGTLYTFTINYADIPLEFTEPDAFIVPYNPTAAVHIDDPTMVAKYAYLPVGTVFNGALKTLAGTRPITKIIFDRFGSVDDTTPDTVEIQEAANENHPEGEIIYAHYNNGDITVSTHANTIYLNSDCSAMFKNMAQLTEIQWGNFFESEALTEVREMFMGCSSLYRVNLTGILNTANVTDMSHMFDGCSSAISIHLGLDFYTSNVTTMGYMFNDCSTASIIERGPHFNTGMVTNMDHMFSNCYSLDKLEMPYPLTSVSNLDYMLYNCSLMNLSFYQAELPINHTISAIQMMSNAVGVNCNLNLISQATYGWLNDPINNTGISHMINVSFSD